VKARPDLEQGADATVDFRLADGRVRDARQDAEQRGFAGTVVADDPYRFAAADLERDVAKRPETLRGALRTDVRLPSQSAAKRFPNRIREGFAERASRGVRAP
jgi:hypothetical protein